MSAISTDILLTTINATYQHCAFGLRYLYANLEELKSQAKIIEFTIQQKPRDMAETLLANRPKIIGLGVYIWNTRESAELVSLLKKTAPEVQIILGGPEVSYEAEDQKICKDADYVVQGEGDFQFRELCRSLLAGTAIVSKFTRGPLPDIQKIALPYSLYSDDDIKNRILYVEASRGCPYKCEFCLSSLDTSVRNFPLEVFLAEMDALISRGARQFKFVDRTFNLSPAISSQILDFFLARSHLGLFLHFEMVPDRLPDALKERIARFPEGALQFEIGIQTWNPVVAKLISRRQDYAKVVENFKFLTENTKVHIHADLIAGLPGEDLESFGRGFDALNALKPEEIQLGLLKRLKGTPILRHDREWGMVYQEAPPFTVVRTKTMDFQTVLKLERYSKFYDLYVNSGNFPASMRRLKELSRGKGSWFWQFWDFAEFLNVRHPQRYAIALVSLVESAWIYFTESLKDDPEIVRKLLIQDYSCKVKRDVPAFLKDEAAPKFTKTRRPFRQAQGLPVH